MIKLSQRQQEVVSHGDGALLVVAGPGTGKTRVLTERVRRLLTEVEGHYRILALTFTNKAANEMKERLAEFQNIEQRAFLGTFHSFCLDVLATRGEAVGIIGIPTVFESYQDRKQVLQQAVASDPVLRAELDQLGDPKEQSKRLSCWLEAISGLKGGLLLPEAVEDALLSRVYSAYNSGLRACSACDFDDMLFLAYRLFTESPNIPDFYRRQYRYILVDEAQDINEAQYRVLQSLCGENYRNVMLVGDPKQAIFVWNGADPKYLALFEKDFHAKTIVLTENFRSSKAVVRAAQKLSPDYSVSGQLPIDGEVGLIEAPDEDQEACQVLDKLQDLLRDGHPDIEGPITLGRCALLARNRYVFDAVEKELKARSIKYFKQVSAQEDSESDLMRNFDLCLRVISNSRDILHFSALAKRLGLSPAPVTLESGLQGIFQAVQQPDPETETLMRATDKLTGGRASMPAALAILEGFANSQTDERVKELQLRDIAEWKLKWDVYVRSRPGSQHSVGGFLSQVALGRTQPATREGLALLSVHAAKGLEFDVVFIIGMCQGTFPDYRAKGAAAAEERRNAFVAVTRSRRLLYCSYPRRKRMPWGDLRAQSKSEYLNIVGL
jgi:DNA helicase-2/ATP-dependent DNA helicase PcrA